MDDLQLFIGLIDSSAASFITIFLLAYAVSLAFSLMDKI